MIPCSICATSTAIDFCGSNTNEESGTSCRTAKKLSVHCFCSSGFMPLRILSVPRRKYEEKIKKAG